MVEIKGAPQGLNEALNTLWHESQDSFMSIETGDDMRAAGYNVSEASYHHVTLAFAKKSEDPDDVIAPAEVEQAVQTARVSAAAFRLEVLTAQEASERGYDVSSETCYFVNFLFPRFSPSKEYGIVRMEHDHGYPTSRDYSKLYELLKQQSLVCFIDCDQGGLICRDVASTVWNGSAAQIVARGCGYIYAFDREMFIRHCEKYKVEYILPQGA